MSKYFIATVRYKKMMDDGMTKKVNEQYLVDALSFTECESKVIEAIRPYISGDFVVAAEKRANIEEVFCDGSGEAYFTCTVNFISLDEKTGKEKKQTHHYMVISNDISKAKATIEKQLDDSVVDFELVKIAETSIVDDIR